MQALTVLIVILTITGCSQFDEKMLGQKDVQGKLICQPVDATGCIGWNF